MTAVMASPSTALRRPAPAARAGAGVRLLRTAVFTAVCVLLAAAGHAMASGRPVPAGSLVIGWLAVFAVVAPLAGRERGLPGITALLACGQLALHMVFSTGQMCTTVTASRPQGGTSALVAVASRLVCGGGKAPLSPAAARQALVQAGLDPSTVGGTVHMPGMLMPGDPGFTTAHNSPGSALSMALSMCSLRMLLGHLLAAVVAGWLLRRGEAALWRLIRLSVRGAAGLTTLAPSALRRACALLAALAAAAPSPRRRVRRAALPAPGRHRSVWLRHCLAGRGPPQVALAA
jgi:hypothetical protein